jgi:Uma2 family endonuclease
MYTQAKYFNLSVDEYLKLELESINKHEYVNGQVYPIFTVSEKQRLITSNIFNKLRTQLYGTKYRVFASDMKLRIEPTNVFYYPEVLVTGESQDRDKTFKTRPCLIVEVLSPGTERIDRHEKLTNYQLIESLQEYLLVSQSLMKVDIYRKNNKTNWSLETLREEDVVKLTSVGLEMPVPEIYEDVY